MNESLHFLARSAVFRDVPEQYLEKIAVHMTRAELDEGSDVLRQADRAGPVYLIASGVVGLFVQPPGLGFAQLLGSVGPLESIGEAAVLTGRQPFTCTALERVVAHAIPGDSFKTLLHRVPPVAAGVARALAERSEALANQHTVPWESLIDRKLDPGLFRWAPEALCRRHRMIPIESGPRSITVAMVDPNDSAGRDALARALGGVRLRVVAVTAEAWERLIGRASTSSPVPSSIPPARAPVSFVDDEGARTARASVNPASGALVVSLVEEIVGNAIALGASDIHIENDRRGVIVRYRVDGLLRPGKELVAHDLHKPILSRLKLLAHMDITETRKPQDGRISVRAESRIVDLRVSTLPAKFGEKVVMRILDAEVGISDLSSLIVVEKMRQTFSQMVHRPQGLVLVSGPTGSGKTTTLYSALAARCRPELNVVTVEDPIEYHLDGVTQVQVHPEIGTTFSLLLRGLLRQDPDVIMIGELRDRDTARMATEASMTGHLVLSSIHSNGAVDAAARLVDLGVERYAVANGLVGVLHQRLVRRTCTSCAERFDYPEPVMVELYRAGAFREGEAPKLTRSKGCAACGGTGFKGRIALYELLVVTEPVRDAIASNADLATLRSVSSAATIGLSRYAGVLLASGMTAPGDVLAALQHASS